MSSEIRQNDINTRFLVTIYSGSAIKDISYATTKQMIFRKPSGTTVTKTANFVTDGTDGQLYYDTVSNDLDESGTWKLQCRVASASNDKKTDFSTFVVHQNL
jgi:hypothetical protein